MIMSMHVSIAAPGGGNLDLGAPYELLAKFEWKGNDWVSEGDTNGVSVDGDSESFTFESYELVYAVVLKGGTDNHVEYYPDGVYSGQLDNTDLSNPGGNPGLSNIKFYTKNQWKGIIGVEKSIAGEVAGIGALLLAIGFMLRKRTINQLSNNIE